MNDKDVEGRSFSSKFDYLKKFHNKLVDLKNMKSIGKNIDVRNQCLIMLLTELLNGLLAKYEFEYAHSQDEKSKKTKKAW